MSASIVGGIAVRVSALLLIWLTLHWLILPHIERWRPWVQTQASQTPGLPVRIGRIEARSRSWVPQVDPMERPPGRPHRGSNCLPQPRRAPRRRRTELS